MSEPRLAPIQQHAERISVHQQAYSMSGVSVRVPGVELQHDCMKDHYHEKHQKEM